MKNKRTQKTKVSKVVLDDPKEKIIEAAVTIFSKHGFEGARTRDIAALAQVNISTLHYHFKSKDGIYAAVIKKIHTISNEQFIPTMIAQKEIIDKSQDKSEIIEAIKVMSLAFIEIIIKPEHKRYAKIIAAEQIDQSKHFKMIFEMVMKRVCEPFTHAISKVLDKKHDSIEVILFSHSLHGVLTSLQHNKSSLMHLTGWKDYDAKNIKHIKKNISRLIDALLQPYL